MKIELFSLKEGKNAFHFEEDSAVLELPKELATQGVVQVDGTVRKQGTRLFLKAVARMTLDAECSRCLEPFHVPLTVPIEIYYTIGADKTDHRKESELIHITNGDQNIDLLGQVRESILLGIPIKPLCGEDCKGLCLQCGTNLNEETCDCVARPPDPRWAALEALRK